MQFGVRSNSAARSVSDFIAAHFTHSGHFCTVATFGSLRNCKVPRPSSCRAMRTASSSLAQSAARYRALHRTTGSSLSGCSRYQEPLQELRSIASAGKRPINAARRREEGWQALQAWCPALRDRTRASSGMFEFGTKRTCPPRRCPLSEVKRTLISPLAYRFYEHTPWMELLRERNQSSPLIA